MRTEGGGRVRPIFFGLGLAVVLAGCLPFVFASSIRDPSVGRSIGFLAQGIGLVLCWGFFPAANRWSRGALLLVLLSALAPRLLLLPAPSSDDVHRYQWEGRLVLAGGNPYAAPADDPRWADHRDPDWERMNHRDRGTVYPPLAMGLFAAMAAIAPPLPPDLLGKAVFVAFDLATLGLLLSLLRRRGCPPSFAFLYSLNPVVLVAFAGEGHYDSAMIAFAFAAVWALEAGRARWSWLLLAASVQTKIAGVVLAPLWLARRVRRGIGSAAALVALTWLPFAAALPDWVRSVWEFGGETAFQGLVPYLLRAGGLPVDWSGPAGLGLLVAGVGFVLANGGDAATVARRLFAAFLLASPVLHFWYLAWIVPFFALRPSLAWGWLFVSQCLYFLVWRQAETAGAWGLPAWAEAVVWIPFLGIGAGEFHRLVRRKRTTPAEDEATDRRAPTVGVVIPTRNAADTLPASLRSLRRSEDPPERIVVVDADSTDGTEILARGHGCEVLRAAAGRGGQIEAGVAPLDTEWVLVLHADCLLHDHAVATIRGLGPEVAGGGCGQRFLGGSVLLAVVEFLNEGRAVFGESYWGDQGMFFRRAHRAAWSGLDRFPLMEDVELSRRLRRAGETRYLGLETRAGTAKWRTGGRLARFRLVFGAVIRFRLAILFGREAEAARKLYRRYYGNRA